MALPKKKKGVTTDEAIGIDASGDLLNLLMNTGPLGHGKDGNKRAQIAFDSKYLESQDYRFKTNIPALDIALSGDIVDGGMSKGVLMLAGKSKHFKSKYGVILMAEFLRNNPDAVAIFYDNEGGTRKSYFRAHGVDLKRVIHIPFMNIEELRNDMVQKFEKWPEGKKLFIFIDSLGTAGSKTEMDNALEGEVKEDMKRAKVIASMMRLISPYHIVKDLFSVIINHTYMSMGQYTKEMMGGGGKAELIASDIWFFSKEELKEASSENAEGKDTKVTYGNKFWINISKSRVVTAGRRIPVIVEYSGGLAKYTGMLEIAESLGVVTIRSGGNKGNVAEFCDTTTGELVNAPVKERWNGDELLNPDIARNEEFWERVIATTDLRNLILDEYTFDGRGIDGLESTEEGVEEVVEVNK